MDSKYTGAEVEEKLDSMATQSWVTSQGYLTQHQDISGKADKSQLTDGSVTKIGETNVGTSNTPIYLKNGIPNVVEKVNPSLIYGGYFSTKGWTYIPTHPEGDGGSIIPFIYNDLAFLTQRGGSINIYTTDSDDLTVQSLNIKYQFTNTNNWDSLFDGSPSYCMFESSLNTQIRDGIIIDIICPSNFQYANVFYIDFGTNTWKFDNIDILVRHDYDENYLFKKTINITEASALTTLSHTTLNPNTGATAYGFKYIRLHLYGKNSSSARIAEIGLINYNSQGVRNTLMSRGNDDKIYRGITPAKNNTYDLGDASYKWANVYATTFNGNATSATKATQDGSGNVITNTYQTKITESNKLPYSLISGTPDAYSKTEIDNKLGDIESLIDAL